METKWLIIQSFKRSQHLLESIQKVIIHLKLKIKGLDDRLSEDELKESKKSIGSFLDRLQDLSIQGEEVGEPIRGIDLRYRKLVRDYIEARGKKNRFKSILFRQHPKDVLDILYSEKEKEVAQLIDSLTELGNLLEEHIAIDTKEIIGEV